MNVTTMTQGVRQPKTFNFIYCSLWVVLLFTVAVVLFMSLLIYEYSCVRQWLYLIYKSDLLSVLKHTKSEIYHSQNH